MHMTSLCADGLLAVLPSLLHQRCKARAQALPEPPVRSACRMRSPPVQQLQLHALAPLDVALKYITANQTALLRAATLYVVFYSYSLRSGAA